MDLNLRISINAPRGAGARLARFFGVPLALVMVAGVAAYAYDTAWIADGQPVSASKLKANLDEVQARLAALESGDAPCLPGYTKDPNVSTYTVCKKGTDEMVKVGSGREAFWVDRYEASVWSAADGTGTQYGGTDSSGTLVLDYPLSFHKNGQRDGSFAPLYAVSKKGVQPSASLTWFQAQQACRASGKRLPTGEEWLRAASGTNDPGANGGGGGACVTQASGPRATGGGSTCVSAWGAEDLIGNMWEWTAEWYAGAGQSGGGEVTRRVNDSLSNWPSGGGSDYRGDATWNLSTAVYNGQTDNSAGLPAAVVRGGGWHDVVRGGGWHDGAQAGVFALYLGNGPSHWNPNSGLRCAAR